LLDLRGLLLRGGEGNKGEEKGGGREMQLLFWRQQFIPTTKE